MWRLTPAMFAAMSRVYEAERKVLDSQFAYIRVLLAEPYRDKTKKADEYQIKDFLLFKDEKAAKKELGPVMTVEQQIEYVKNVLVPHFSARAEADKRRE